MTETDGLGESSISAYITSIIFLCVTTIISVIYASVKLPNNSSIVGTILGIATPVLVGLLGKILQVNHSIMNHRLDDLLRVTAQNSFAAGAAASRAKSLAILKKEAETNESNPSVSDKLP